tara:strand:- start:166 stop:492 length:327 start_codon:yes stop_codon:yes gene_type:complete
MSRKSRKFLPWEGGRFHTEDQDPLTGFANIMDVMLVFALGLIVALISQSEEMRTHFASQGVTVEQGKELVDVPDSVKQQMQGGDNGMESVGTVYRDPKTGKLILVGAN